MADNPIEMTAMNELVEDYFTANKKCGCADGRLSTALNPICQKSFPLIVSDSNEEKQVALPATFGDVNKFWFMRIFAMKLNDLFNQQEGSGYGFNYKILRGQLGAGEVQMAQRYDDPNWLQFIGVSDEAKNLFTDRMDGKSASAKVANKADEETPASKQVAPGDISVDFDDDARRSNAKAAAGCDDFGTVCCEAFYMMYGKEKQIGAEENLKNIFTRCTPEDEMMADFVSSRDLQ